MIRKLVIGLMVCVLGLFSVGWAQEVWTSSMTVVNCDSWVSLRQSPSSSAQRLARVPKGAQVTSCVATEKGFVQVTYEGQTGYILSQYLERSEWSTVLAPALLSIGQLQQNGTEIMSFGTETDTVLATRGYTEDEQESLALACYRNGEQVWGYTLVRNGLGQYQTTTAFMAGDGAQPLVMLYGVDLGLWALSIEDGSVVWSISAEEMEMGASICYLVDEDGTMYIAGLESFDPVAVSASGEVLWRADAADVTVYAPYRVSLMEGELLCCYDCLSGEEHVEIRYDLTDGKKIASRTTAQIHDD